MIPKERYLVTSSAFNNHALFRRDEAALTRFNCIVSMIPLLFSSLCVHINKNPSNTEIFVSGAQGGSRTLTPLRAHPPQGCEYTSSSTWATIKTYIFGIIAKAWAIFNLFLSMLYCVFGFEYILCIIFTASAFAYLSCSALLFSFLLT